MTTETDSDDPFTPFDLMSPPIFAKGWYRIAEEIRVDKEKAKFYLQKLLEWFDSQCGTGWRSKVAVIDLVLPNPVEGLNTISGFLIGRRIGEAQADDILSRHEACVKSLKEKRSSIGLHGVFVRGLPQIDDNPPPKSMSALKEALKGKTIENLHTQHMLYSSIQQPLLKPSTSVKGTPSNDCFVAKVIGYTPQREEQHHPLGGAEDQNVDDNWRVYLDLVKKTLPEIKAVAAMPIVTPGAEDDSTLTFNPAGQVFIAFTEDARSDDRAQPWDPDCLCLMRQLVIFALVSNASLVKQAALTTERKQVESHEIGTAYTALQTRLLQFTNIDPNSDPERLAQSGEAIFFEPLWQAALDHLYLWTTKTNTALSSPSFARCSTLRNWIEACWNLSINVSAIRKFGKQLDSLRKGANVANLENEIENWLIACRSAIQIDGDERLLNGQLQQDEELAGLIRGICAVMRDIIKHEGEAIVTGGKTQWSIRFEDNHPSDHLFPDVHPALIIEQTNPVSQKDSSFTENPNSGQTTLVVRRNLTVFSRFDRHHSESQHRDTWGFIDGSIFNALKLKEASE